MHKQQQEVHRVFDAEIIKLSRFQEGICTGCPIDLRTGVVFDLSFSIILPATTQE